ncbi:hypothetical protein [Caballeronia fortuita]|uniref:hypothetical protein n=1 Tax=Caballeronia fortuita TaxID=1777138 RepID=UPI00404250BD
MTSSRDTASEVSMCECGSADGGRGAWLRGAERIAARRVGVMMREEEFSRWRGREGVMRRCGRRWRVSDQIAICASSQMIDGAVLWKMRIAGGLRIGCADGREQRLDARMLERLRCGGRERKQEDRAYRSEPPDFPDDASTQVMHAAQEDDDDERTIMPCALWRFPCMGRRRFDAFFVLFLLFLLFLRSKRMNYCGVVIDDL